jgi:hypothetical protein
MKLFTGSMLAAGLVLGASAAQAQMPGPHRVSDFNGPYGDAPYSSEPYYRSEPYYPPPPPVAVPAPPPRYGYGGGYGYDYAPAPALLPPHEVYAIIREAGFSPLGIPRQRGYVYTIAVIDREGEDGRLVIDARSGRILRFVPAWQSGAGVRRIWDSAYVPPGAPPPTIAVRAAPRPPASVPHVASRSVPVPKPSPVATKPAVEPAKPAEVAARPAVEPPSQPAAAKTADAAPAATAAPATIGQVPAKPAPAILPTQDMPKVQALE